MSTISATRRGFLYQDRFAVATYLDKLQGRNIKEYYIDFPLAGQKSLDVKFIDGLGNEFIYEVKSGEEFKKDKRKKESSEVRDAFIGLKEYLDFQPDVGLHLVIREGFKEKIADYWTSITYLHSHLISQAQSRSQLSWLSKKLRLPGTHSDQDLFDFCQRITLSDFRDDQPSNTLDPFPDIDDFVLQKIRDLSRTFSADICQIEYPDSILMTDLYHKCRLYAGIGQNIHLVFLDTVVDFFAHRKFLDENYDPGARRGRSKEELKEGVRRQLNLHIEGQVTTPTSTTQADFVPEGQETNEEV